jgi:hypothetical protein
VNDLDHVGFLHITLEVPVLQDAYEEVEAPLMPAAKNEYQNTK